MRNISYHSSGVATIQKIATYLDETRIQLLDVKVIENSDITSSGNVGTTVISRYLQRQATDSLEGDINELASSAIDKQTITTNASDFDDRGNALEQTIISEYYGLLPDGQTYEFIFSEAQKTKNTYDIYDDVAEAWIENYYDEDLLNFSDSQVITYLERDDFGNVLQQTVDTYTQKCIDSGTIPDPVNLVNHQSILNTYTGQNLTQTQVRRWSTLDEEDSSRIDRTVTDYSDFDSRHFARLQETKRYIYEEGAELYVTRTVIDAIDHANINNRGDSSYQEITTHRQLYDDEGNHT